MISHSRQQGFGLIEVVIVTALIVTALFGFAQTGATAVRLLHTQQDNLEATLLAREALEAVRSARDESWSANIAWRTVSPLASPSLRYYPVIVNSKWSLATTSPGLINGKYARYVVFAKVCRNGSDDIVSSCGTDDPGTRKVVATATSTTQSVTLTTYITDFQSYLNPSAETKSVSFENAITGTNLAAFPSNNAGTGDPAQGFTIGATAISVSKIELFLRSASATPSDIYVELRTSPTGTVLGTSNMITATTMATTSPAWVEFRFFSPVALAAATKYYVRLRSTPSSTDAGSGSVGSLYWDYYQQSPSGPYAGGEARRYIGQLSNPADAGQSLDQYDYGFRIYALP